MSLTELQDEKRKGEEALEAILRSSCKSTFVTRNMATKIFHLYNVFWSQNGYVSCKCHLPPRKTALETCTLLSRDSD